jgi:tetratricopeptide (TPR) repeat protein
MLRKAAVVSITLVLLCIIASGVASASPNSQAELTPFEFLMVVLTEAYYEDALTDELSELLADYFFDEAIPSATGETADEVRERLKARFYPSQTPEPFEILIAALTGADESGALTDEISGTLYEYFVTDLIPFATGDTPEDVRERLSDPARIRKKAADFYIIRGRRYYENGHLDLAIVDYTKAIELDPDNSYFYDSRAETYEENGQYELAIEDYTRAIELDPDNLQRYHARGSTYLIVGEYEL